MHAVVGECVCSTFVGDQRCKGEGAARTKSSSCMERSVAYLWSQTSVPGSSRRLRRCCTDHRAFGHNKMSFERLQQPLRTGLFKASVRENGTSEWQPGEICCGNGPT